MCQNHDADFNPSSCAWRDIQAENVEDAVDQFHVCNVGWIADYVGLLQDLSIYLHGVRALVIQIYPEVLIMAVSLDAI